MALQKVIPCLYYITMWGLGLKDFTLKCSVNNKWSVLDPKASSLQPEGESQERKRRKAGREKDKVVTFIH